MHSFSFNNFEMKYWILQAAVLAACVAAASAFSASPALPRAGARKAVSGENGLYRTSDDFSPR
jgi:hypothetical protein